jgi:hypothetical protein
MSASGPQILAAESRWRTFLTESIDEQRVAQMIHDYPSASNSKTVPRADLRTLARIPATHMARSCRYLLSFLAVTAFRATMH